VSSKMLLGVILALGVINFYDFYRFCLLDFRETESRLNSTLDMWYRARCMSCFSRF